MLAYPISFENFLMRSATLLKVHIMELICLYHHSSIRSCFACLLACLNVRFTFAGCILYPAWLVSLTLITHVDEDESYGTNANFDRKLSFLLDSLVSKSSYTIPLPLAIHDRFVFILLLWQLFFRSFLSIRGGTLFYLHTFALVLGMYVCWLNV